MNATSVPVQTLDACLLCQLHPSKSEKCRYPRRKRTNHLRHSAPNCNERHDAEIIGVGNPENINASAVIFAGCHDICWIRQTSIEGFAAVDYFGEKYNPLASIVPVLPSATTALCLRKEIQPSRSRRSRPVGNATGGGDLAKENCVMVTAMMNPTATGMPGTMPAGMGTAMPGGAPGMSYLMVPRCTIKMEKCTGGMKMQCVCDDKVAAGMLQNLCALPGRHDVQLLLHDERHDAVLVQSDHGYVQVREHQGRRLHHLRERRQELLRHDSIMLRLHVRDDASRLHLLRHDEQHAGLLLLIAAATEDTEPLTKWGLAR